MSKQKLIDPSKPVPKGDLCPFISNMAVAMGQVSGPASILAGGPQTVPVSIAAPAPCARDDCRLWLEEAQDCSVRQIARFALGTLGLTEALASHAGIDTEGAIAQTQASLAQATARAAGDAGEEEDPPSSSVIDLP